MIKLINFSLSSLSSLSFLSKILFKIINKDENLNEKYNKNAKQEYSFIHISEIATI